MNTTNNTIMGPMGGGMPRGGGARNRGGHNQNVYASQQYQRRASQQSTNTVNTTANLMMLGSIDQADQTAD